VRKVLAAARLDLKDVVRVTSYLGKQDDLAEYNRVYREIFSEPYPARSTLMGCLGTLLRFEVDVVAYRER
jgi:2-iminobutanoate/2-iminopropanoate deaminase